MRALRWEDNARVPAEVNAETSERRAVWLVIAGSGSRTDEPFVVVGRSDPMDAVLSVAAAFNERRWTLPPEWQVHPLRSDGAIHAKGFRELDYTAFTDEFIEVRL